MSRRVQIDLKPERVAYKPPVEKYRKEIGQFNRKTTQRAAKQQIDRQVHPQVHQQSRAPTKFSMRSCLVMLLWIALVLLVTFYLLNKLVEKQQSELLEV